MLLPGSVAVALTKSPAATFSFVLTLQVADNTLLLDNDTLVTDARLDRSCPGLGGTGLLFLWP